MSAWLAVATLELGAGCGRQSEDVAPNEVVEIVAAHRSADIDPGGKWFDLGKSDAWMLHVQQTDAGHWTLHSKSLQPAPDGSTRDASFDVATSGVLSDGVLSLESPLWGSSRLYLCRFAGQELLLPEKNVQFVGESIPTGMVFRRLTNQGPLDDFPRTVLEPLPAGTWEGVGCPEWAWLEIRQTGVDGEHWVRRCRWRGDDAANGFVRATWGIEGLRLDSPLFGETSWRLRQAGDEVWLVPANGSDEEPGTIRFRLANRVARSVGPLVGPMDLPLY
jgi:hypothetical protein